MSPEPTSRTDAPTDLTALVANLPAWTFVTGKGGVGKTTVAGALALGLADGGKHCLLASLDPAHSLGDLFDLSRADAPTPVPGAEGLSIIEIDAAAEHDRFIELHGADIRTILDRGTYLLPEEVDEFLGLALPGVDEIGSLLFLLRLGSGEVDGFDRIVLDTAPTGHTLRLLEAARVVRDVLGALGAMESKHRVLAEAFTGRYSVDASARFIVETADAVESLEARLRDRDRTGFVVVTAPGEVVRAETKRLVDRLLGDGYALSGVVGNRGVDPASVGDAVRVRLELLPADPVGTSGLRWLLGTAAKPGRPPPSGSWGDAVPYAVPADRSLYLVVGKGGVGKTTVASALALELAARRGERAILLGVDPAGSLADVLGSVGPIEGVEVRELEAAERWTELREDYRDRVDALFREVFGSGDASADRAVIGRLIDLAPPGIDEVMAVGSIAAAAERGDAVYVVDTAPTGHLLRLLATPGLVRDWVRGVMRLLLRHREVMPLGELGEELLALARRLDTLDRLLRDADRSAIFVVTREEALGGPESARLAAALDERGMNVEAWMWNRRRGDGVPATRPPEGVPEVVLPEMDPPPVGAAALRTFVSRWRRVQRG